MKKTQIIYLIVLPIIVMFLNSCGSSEDSIPSPIVSSGRFTYGPVNGLTYEAGELSGTTDADGRYEYYADEPISFYIGDMFLGTVSGKPRITPEDFVENSDKSDEAKQKIVSHMCQLLMVLDSDGNPNNGIAIKSETSDLFNREQNVYPDDLCLSFVWQGISYRVFYDSPDDDSSCEEQENETLVHVKLNNSAVGTDDENSLFSVDSNEFNTHSGLANLFLNAFSDIIEQDTVTCIYYDDDIHNVTDGWYSPFWALPERYWSYQRKLASKHLSVALTRPYLGVYSGSFKGENYSGNLEFNLAFNSFASCTVQNYFGTTCNGSTAEVVNEFVDVRTGSVGFTIPDCNLNFQGFSDPDTGELSGSFYSNNDLQGSFTCQKYLD